MPQLMPLYWVNSVFVIMLMFFSLLLLYFYKNMEVINKEEILMNYKNNFNLMW